MEHKKNNKTPLVFVYIFGCLLILNVLIPKKIYGASFLDSYGGKILPRIGTMCFGLEPAFDLITEKGTKGPFAITPTTKRYQFYTTYGAPLRKMLLNAFPLKVPSCLEPCGTATCPLFAYPVFSFGTSLIP